jgi:hypothetical protein
MSSNNMLRHEAAALRRQAHRRGAPASAPVGADPRSGGSTRGDAYRGWTPVRPLEDSVGSFSRPRELAPLGLCSVGSEPLYGLYGHDVHRRLGGHRALGEEVEAVPFENGAGGRVGRVGIDDVDAVKRRSPGRARQRGSHGGLSCPDGFLCGPVRLVSR